MATGTQPAAEPEESVTFLLQARESELKGQADAFNQLDSKTGVILGFAFVSVVQLLAAVYRNSADSINMISAHPYIVFFLFVPRSCSYCLAQFWDCLNYVRDLSITE